MELQADKAQALTNVFNSLEGILNKTALCEQYLGKSQSWFSQRLNNCSVRNVSVTFKEQDYTNIAEAFRDIAKRLQAHADEIDKAKFE